MHASNGLDLPERFAAEDHTAIYKRMSVLASLLHCEKDNIRNVFSSAWICVAYRIYAAIEHDDEFRDLIAKGTAPPAFDRYRQERALFGCVTSTLSAFECFFMGAYAVGAAKGARGFPLGDPRHLVKYPRDVLAAFEKDYPSEPFTAQARAAIESTRFASLDELRNVLAHRGVLPRRHEEDVDNGTSKSSILKTPLATEWEYATILNDQTTRIYVAWLVRTLNELLPRLRTFVEAA